MAEIPTSQEFNDASEEFRKLGTEKKLSREELLEGYALFKQGTLGDNTKAAPSFFKAEEKSKWEAYNGKKGVSPEDAQAQYIEFVSKLKEKYDS